MNPDTTNKIGSSGQTPSVPAHTGGAEDDCSGGAAGVVHSRDRRQPPWPVLAKVLALDTKALPVSGLDEVKGLDTEAADTPTSTAVATRSLPSTSTPTQILLHQGHSIDGQDDTQAFEIVYTPPLGTQQIFDVRANLTRFVLL